MSAPKRILYLSYDGLTDPLGQSQILPYLEGPIYQRLRYYPLSVLKNQIGLIQVAIISKADVVDIL